MSKRPLIMSAFIVAIALVWATVPSISNAQTEQRCFPETNQCISGPIRAYWERGGGLSVFGFPITAQTNEIVEGRLLQVQWFERDRLEIQANGQVTTGRLGVERLGQLGTPWQQGPGGAAGPDCQLFPETGYQICGAIATYWKANGGLERFGFPITGAFETILEGKPYTVQYFERRRFELHPEIGPQAVLLGLLGREVLDNRLVVIQPTPAPQPAPSLPPPSYNNCQADPSAGQAPNYPVKIVGIDDKNEIVYLKNVSPQPVNLDGWIMCSIRGNQQHTGIGGTLTAGEERGFTYSGGSIWNNTESDPGALYTPQGQLVSYWAD